LLTFSLSLSFLELVSADEQAKGAESREGKRQRFDYNFLGEPEVTSTTNQSTLTPLSLLYLLHFSA